MTNHQDTTKRSRVLQFQPSGPPPGGGPDGGGYRIKVGDQITVEIRLTVTDITHHPDRAFVIGKAEDGSMVTFDADAPRGIFWNWD